MRICISIHAPSRERLGCFYLAMEVPIYFNPRSLTGATPFSYTCGGIAIYFNPRSLTGATVHAGSTPMITGAFQSTLPYGSDTWGRIIPIGNTDFNPRSLTGATVETQPAVAGEPFQSTLPYGSDGHLCQN